MANERVMTMIKQLAALNEQIQSLGSELAALRETLEAEKTMILRYLEEAVIDYKASIEFRKSLERSGVTGYYIALTRFNVRY